MAGYCISEQIYFYELKAGENDACKCNIQPFFIFASAIMCLLPTFTIIKNCSELALHEYRLIGCVFSMSIFNINIMLYGSEKL